MAQGIKCLGQTEFSESVKVLGEELYIWPRETKYFFQVTLKYSTQVTERDLYDKLNMQRGYFLNILS